jgi:hypothetical protein
MPRARGIAQDMKLTASPVLSPASYIYHKTREVFEKHDAMDLFNLYAHGNKTIKVQRLVPKAIHSRTRVPGSKRYNIYDENLRLGQLMFGDHNRRLKGARKSATERIQIVWPESFPRDLSLSLSILIDDLLAEYKKSLDDYFHTKEGATAFMRTDHQLVQVAALNYLTKNDRDSGSQNDPSYDAVAGFLEGMVVPERVFFSGPRVLRLELSGVVAIPSADGVRILLFPYSGSSYEVGTDIANVRGMISQDSKFLTDLRSCVRYIDEEIFTKETRRSDVRWILGLEPELFSFMPYTQPAWKDKRAKLLASQRYDDMDSMVLSESEVIAEANWNAIGKVAKYFGLLNMVAGPLGPAASFFLGALGEGVPELINMQMADEAEDYERYRDNLVTTLVGLMTGAITDVVQYAGTAWKTKVGVPIGEVSNVGSRLSAGSNLPNEARSLIDTIRQGGIGSPNGSLRKCEEEWRRRESRAGPSNSTGRS